MKISSVPNSLLTKFHTQQTIQLQSYVNIKMVLKVNYISSEQVLSIHIQTYISLQTSSAELCLTTVERRQFRTVFVNQASPQLFINSCQSAATYTYIHTHLKISDFNTSHPVYVSTGGGQLFQFGHHQHFGWWSCHP